MGTLISVFMVFACLMCMFAVMVVVREIILDGRASRAKQSKEAPVCDAPVAKVAEHAPVVEPEKTEEPETVVAEVEETLEETAVAEAEEPEEADDGTIKFAPRTVQTLEQKYLALSAEYRGYYDEIVKYALSKEGAKRIKNARYEEYKQGNTRLVRLLIKRGVVICEFILQNSDFKNYINENKVSVKQAATVMKVEDAATVQAAKDSVDIVVQAIAEEKEYKKQLARERRRQARASKKNN